MIRPPSKHVDFAEFPGVRIIRQLRADIIRPYIRKPRKSGKTGTTSHILFLSYRRFPEGGGIWEEQEEIKVGHGITSTVQFELFENLE